MDFSIQTTKHQELIDITERVESIAKQSGMKEGLCNIFVQHTTAGITINENADPHIAHDILETLESLIPKRAGYKHDSVDGNAHAHIKAFIVGPSVSIPIQNEKLLLGSWQAVFLCEFDGPRKRTVTVTILPQASPKKNI